MTEAKTPLYAQLVAVEGKEKPVPRFSPEISNALIEVSNAVHEAATQKVPPDVFVETFLSALDNLSPREQVFGRKVISQLANKLPRERTYSHMHESSREETPQI